ncbi:MAG: response regulator [Eubacterium sp.]|nr:response regulator [Eubacterium sp.]
MKEKNRELRILIAEDEPLVLMGFEEMISDAGYIVADAVSDGETAVSRALELQPDLIVMDINMPGVDGLTAAERIKEKADIPIIIVTGYRSEKFIDRASGAYVSAYLQKPVDEYELKSAIKLALAQMDKFRAVSQERDEAERKLSERKVIERAKGFMMDTFGLSEAQAMKALQKKSANENKKLYEVAKDIIEAGSKI